MRRINIQGLYITSDCRIDFLPGRLKVIGPSPSAICTIVRAVLDQSACSINDKRGWIGKKGPPSWRV